MTDGVSSPASDAYACAALDTVAEGLYQRLTVRSAEQHEEELGGALAELKATGATTMLVPAQYGGRGATAAVAVRFQIALGSLAPSAAIATTMHHYKIAALGGVAAADHGTASAILEDIARRSQLLASGGAESTPGRDLRTLGSWATRDEGGYRVSGLKRPCSLSSSMDLLSLMVELRAADGTPEGYAQAFVPADSAGVEREEFWRNPVFLAAESHAVRLSGVLIPTDRVFPLHGETGRRFATDCYIWFQLLITASYLGVAWCVARATAEGRRARAHGWSGAATRLRELESALLQAARAVDQCRPAETQLNLAVQVRDRVEDEIAAVGGRLLQAAGGASFASSGFHTALTGALNAIAFHPPQRGSRVGVGLEPLAQESRDRD